MCYAQSYLVWPQVDRLEKIVRLEPGETKNEQARTIPLMDDLYEMLVLQKQKRDQYWPNCPWLFFRYGQKIRDFRGAWDEACKEQTCGITRLAHPRGCFTICGGLVSGTWFVREYLNASR